MTYVAKCKGTRRRCPWSPKSRHDGATDKAQHILGIWGCEVGLHDPPWDSAIRVIAWKAVLCLSRYGSADESKSLWTHVEIKCQLDATDDFYCNFIACSTGFGHHYAHHQELESIIQVVAACGIWCFGFQVVGMVWSWGLCVRFAGCCLYNTLELLMMGIAVPETCWASNKICNKNHLLRLVGILFPHISVRNILTVSSYYLPKQR